jgi:hypothetical protein
VVHFPDEELEDPIEEARLTAAGETADLEELLERQHYAFAPEPQDE